MLSLGSLVRCVSRRRNPLTPLNAGHRTTIEERLGLPPKPKKPMSAYCLFIQQVMPKIRMEYPKDRFRVAGEQWRQVDLKVIQELEEKASKERLVYAQAMERYNSVLSKDDKTAIKAARSSDKLLRQKRTLKKKLHSMGMPKKPMNSYLLFVNDWLAKHPETYLKEANQQLSVAWRSFPQTEKEKWETLYKKLTEEYQTKMREWEAEMIKEGKLEVTYDSLLTKSSRIRKKKLQGQESGETESV